MTLPPQSVNTLSQSISRSQQQTIQDKWLKDDGHLNP
jgi:hypothetical protein